MIADRFEITEDAWGEPLINGSRAIMWSDTALIGAIRQQARDIAELRDELASAIGERERVFALHTKGLDDGYRLTTDLAAAVARAEQAEARLAAIGAAPTVASLGIDHDGKHRGLYFPHPHRSALTAVMDARDGWTIQELIARPAKDQT